MSPAISEARWRQAQRRIVESGADLVLCGHDHQESAELLHGTVVISTASTLSARSRGGRPGSFNFVAIEPSAIQVTFFRWEAGQGKFRPSDTVAFARRRNSSGKPEPQGAAAD